MKNESITQQAKRLKQERQKLVSSSPYSVTISRFAIEVFELGYDKDPSVAIATLSRDQIDACSFCVFEAFRDDYISIYTAIQSETEQTMKVSPETATKLYLLSQALMSVKADDTKKMHKMSTGLWSMSTQELSYWYGMIGHAPYAKSALKALRTLILGMATVIQS